tara:strand:- start:369 stop:575 length:207 start_codon:yes stop_codon:yes gene_type:complete
MNASSNWEYLKQDKDKILWVHICTKDLTGISISLNKWWKTRYPEYKMRVVSKNEFEYIKTQERHRNFT